MNTTRARRFNKATLAGSPLRGIRKSATILPFPCVRCENGTIYAWAPADHGYERELVGEAWCDCHLGQLARMTWEAHELRRAAGPAPSMYFGDYDTGGLPF